MFPLCVIVATIGSGFLFVGLVIFLKLQKGSPHMSHEDNQELVVYAIGIMSELNARKVVDFDDIPDAHFLLSRGTAFFDQILAADTVPDDQMVSETISSIYKLPKTFCDYLVSRWNEIIADERERAVLELEDLDV